VKLQYLSSPTQSYSARRVCGARCEWCKAAGAACTLHTDVFAPAQCPLDTSSGPHLRSGSQEWLLPITAWSLHSIASMPTSSTSRAIAVAPCWRCRDAIMLRLSIRFMPTRPACSNLRCATAAPKFLGHWPRERCSRADPAPRRCAGAWKTIEGEFNAIMAVVMPCRSDRSDSGLAPFAHMADGIIHLIMVKKCSALQYLRFLMSIPQNGVIPEDFPYVEAVDATAVRIDPLDGAWHLRNA